MKGNNWLGLLIVGAIGISAYLIAMRPQTAWEDYDLTQEDWWG